MARNVRGYMYTHIYSRLVLWWLYRLGSGGEIMRAESRHRSFRASSSSVCVFYISHARCCAPFSKRNYLCYYNKYVIITSVESIYTSSITCAIRPLTEHFIHLHTFQHVAHQLNYPWKTSCIYVITIYDWIFNKRNTPSRSSCKSQ